MLRPLMRSRYLIQFCTCLLLLAVPLDLFAQKRKRRSKKSKRPLREIRLAVFDIGILKGIDVESKAVTDQIVTLLSTLDKVKLVNRDQMQKVADEQKIALSGLVESRSAVKLGKFVNANYVVVGRASRIGQTNYLVLKFVDVETTVQTTIAAKAPADKGVDGLLTKVGASLKKNVRNLQTPKQSANDAALAKLRKMIKPLKGSVFLVAVDEKHINRPLKDPAAQMAIVQRLKTLGMSAIAPVSPVKGWKEALLRKGRYGKTKVHYLIEGDGISAFAARLNGLTSCRGRVELRVIRVPGRAVTASDRGVAAGVDLVEALAAKSALEKSGTLALDAVMERLIKEVSKPKK